MGDFFQDMKLQENVRETYLSVIDNTIAGARSEFEESHTISDGLNATLELLRDRWRTRLLDTQDFTEDPDAQIRETGGRGSSSSRPSAVQASSSPLASPSSATSGGSRRACSAVARPALPAGAPNSDAVSSDGSRNHPNIAHSEPVGVPSAPYERAAQPDHTRKLALEESGGMHSANTGRGYQEVVASGTVPHTLGIDSPAAAVHGPDSVRFNPSGTLATSTAYPSVPREADGTQLRNGQLENSGRAPHYGVNNIPQGDGSDGESREGSSPPSKRARHDGEDYPKPSEDLGSDDSDDEVESAGGSDGNAENYVLAQHDSVKKGSGSGKWKVRLKDCILHLNGRDYLFKSAACDLDW